MILLFFFIVSLFAEEFEDDDDFFKEANEEYIRIYGVCGDNWFLNEYGVCERCWDYNLCKGYRFSYPCPFSFFRFYEKGAEEIYPKEIIEQARRGCEHYLYGSLFMVDMYKYRYNRSQMYMNDNREPPIPKMKIKMTMPKCGLEEQ